MRFRHEGAPADGRDQPPLTDKVSNSPCRRRAGNAEFGTQRDGSGKAHAGRIFAGINPAFDLRSNLRPCGFRSVELHKRSR
ncbi:hypothetical protein TG1_46 [Streptomyces phage TG1]|uniref:Uncharacterized protein n=1 Tax=Streptomyces phage TG1 TaxID=2927987 RepID=K4HYL9_9CAUD|nr:hypothetical protein D281_gp47 [Streptomyces phage TG1]AFU62241.1 hypothetical protein TG1_46 [Streptomyces phage TG1]